MDVATYGRTHGVSARRVRALIASGSIAAMRHGRRWQIDERSIRETPSRRPLSPNSRQALSTVLQSRSIETLHGQMRRRTAARVRALRESEDPAALLADWWGRQAPVILDVGSSLAARAIAGDHQGVRQQLRRRSSRYLREPADLAAAVLTERTIRGLSLQDAAAAAGVETKLLRSIESGDAAPLAAIRRVLRVLDIQPSALPTPEVSP